MSHPIKTVLVVGLGSIGKRHVGIIKELFPEINIVVLRHRQCDKNDIDALGLYKCVTSIDKAIETNPQAAIIANPATKHIEVAEQLANKGIHLLIEKPISDSSMGVQALINICHQNNVVLMTAYNLRFLPSLIEFKKQLQANKIGNIYSVRSEVGQYLPSWRIDKDYRKSVSSQKKMGGGVLEKEGMKRALREASRSDLVLVMSVVGESFEAPSFSGASVLRVFNKVDLFDKDKVVFKVGCFYISAKSGEGVESLVEGMYRAVGVNLSVEVPVLARRRHVSLLKKARSFVRGAGKGLRSGLGLELVAEDIRGAQNALGNITNPVSSDELLGKIFSDFCVGK